MFGYACVSVCSHGGGRVVANPLPVQLHVKAHSSETTLRSHGSTTLQGLAGYNDLVPHQYKCEIFG